MCPAAVLGGDLWCIPSQAQPGGRDSGWMGSLPHSQPCHPSPAPPATIPSVGTYFPCLVCTEIAGGEQLFTCKTSSEPSHLLNTEPTDPSRAGGKALAEPLLVVLRAGHSWDPGTREALLFLWYVAFSHSFYNWRSH